MEHIAEAANIRTITLASAYIKNAFIFLYKKLIAISLYYERHANIRKLRAVSINDPVIAKVE